MMAVGIGITVKLEGQDNTGAAFKSAGANAERYNQQVVQIKQGWANTATAISTSILAITAIAKPLFDMFAAPIKMAMEADKSYSRLLKTLKATGQIVGETEQSIEKYISSVELLTLTDEKLVAGVLATNLAFGMTLKQAKLAVEASAALAKINGTDMPSANQLLLQSMNMQLRGLAKVVPEVNKLSEAQLRSGEAVSVVIKKLGYLNEMTSTTPYLALGRGKVMWEDFQRAVGRAMMSGVDWNRVYDRTKKIMEDLLKAVDDNKEGIAKFGVKIVEAGISAIDKMASATILLIPLLSELMDVISKTTSVVAIFVVPWVQLALAVGLAYAAMTGNDALYTSTLRIMGGFHRMLQNSIKDLGTIRTEVDKTKSSIDRLGSSLNRNTSRKKDVEEDSGPKATGNLSGFKNAMNTRVKEQRAATDKMKKDAAEAASWISKVWTEVKLGFGIGKKEEPIKKTGPSQKADWAAGAEIGNTKTGDKFGDKALTTNKQLPELKRVANDEITALTKSGEAKRETELLAAMAKINKLEDDNNKLGLGREKDLQNARAQILNNYNSKRLEAEKSVAALIGDEESNLVYDQLKRMMDLLDLQIERGNKQEGIAYNTQEEMLKLTEKFDLERLEMERSVLDEIDDMTGDSYAKEERKYERYLDKLKQMRDAGKLGPVGSEEAAFKFEKSKGKVDQARDQARSQTSGGFYKAVTGNKTMHADEIQKLDNVVKDANQVVTNIAGGAQSIIQSIGNLWGPVGALIAAIVNFLRISPEDFKQFINELISAIMVLVENIITNVGNGIEIIAEAIPDILASIIEELLSANTWFTLIESLLGGVKKLLKGVWYWFVALIMGKKMANTLLGERKDRITPEKGKVTPTGPVKFGSDLADQGENKFKIKDVSANKAGSGGSLSLVADKLPEIVEESSMTFVESLISGLKTALEDAWGWFKDLGAKIWDGLVQAVTTAWEWLATLGQKIWDGLVAAVTIAWEYLATWGQKIWDGLVAAVTIAWEWLATLGQKIWDGLVAAVTIAWEYLATIGAKIWDGLVAGVTGAWEWLSTLGAKIWDGLVSTCKNLSWEWLATIGAKIWDGLVAAVRSLWTWLTTIGARIWDGLKSSLSTAPQSFINLGKSIWTGLQSGISGAWSWFKDIGKQIWNGLFSTGGGGGSIGNAISGGIKSIGKALGFSRGGDVTHNMKGSNLVPIFSAMGALRAQDGIQSVPGAGISDTVPILARAGERVLTPQQARSMDNGGGSITLNISINVASGSKGLDKTDIKEMGEKIIEYIKRESKNGRNILRPSGVY